MNRKYDATISHSPEDYNWVDDVLMPPLKQAGLKILLGKDEYLLGAPKKKNMELALESSRNKVLVLTPSWVEKEWNKLHRILKKNTISLENRRDLIPLYLKPCDLPPSIEKLEGIDFSNPASNQANLYRLVKQLTPKRIFITYKHNATADELLANEFAKLLGENHEVFFDQQLSIGVNWAKTLENQIKESDFLIAFLSADSVNSEMVEYEIKLAHELAKKQKGRPVILPVRVAYKEPFSYTLGPYLNHLNWAEWNSESDTPYLIEQIKNAIEGDDLPKNEQKPHTFFIPHEPGFVYHPHPSAQLRPKPKNVEDPEETTDDTSPFYVERNTDQLVLESIKRQGVTISIKGARQMGKSCLLMRVIEAAKQAAKLVAFLDFQLINKADLAKADIFYPQFCSWLSDCLGIPDRVEEYWKSPLGNNQKCDRYVGRYLLKELNKPLVLAIDETERIFEADFSSDFFGMLRSWHNRRRPAAVWKQLDLVLVTSTEPYQFIDNLNQSPFNVGTKIGLSEFIPEQVTYLNRLHGNVLTPKQENTLYALLGGHPFLTRKALYLVANKRMTAKELFANASKDGGPFGDHLRYHLIHLQKNKKLVKGFLQILENQRIQDDVVFYRLEGAGLVRREENAIVPRCKLYADYFKKYLHE